jgi:hypothetical protein
VTYYKTPFLFAGRISHFTFWLVNITYDVF